MRTGALKSGVLKSSALKSGALKSGALVSAHYFKLFFENNPPEFNWYYFDGPGKRNLH